MTAAEILAACRKQAAKRHPKCEVEVEVTRVRHDAASHRASWLSGCTSGGWVATAVVHGRTRAVARHEATGLTAGRAAAALAQAMGVEVTL